MFQEQLIAQSSVGQTDIVISTANCLKRNMFDTSEIAVTASVSSDHKVYNVYKIQL